MSQTSTQSGAIGAKETKNDILSLDEKEKLEEIISSLANSLLLTVANIESLPPTTEHHYGDYLSLLTKLIEASGADKDIVLVILSRALLDAGANREGVEWANRLLG